MVGQQLSQQPQDQVLRLEVGWELSCVQTIWTLEEVPVLGHQVADLLEQLAVCTTRIADVHVQLQLELEEGHHRLDSFFERGLPTNWHDLLDGFVEECGEQIIIHAKGTLGISQLENIAPLLGSFRSLKVSNLIQVVCPVLKVGSFESSWVSLQIIGFQTSML